MAVARNGQQPNRAERERAPSVGRISEDLKVSFAFVEQYDAESAMQFAARGGAIGEQRLEELYCAGDDDGRIPVFGEKSSRIPAEIGVLAAVQLAGSPEPTSRKQGYDVPEPRG